ncbi:MAG: radical SAM family heme chaperone HemW [Verrucomicrobia bacterium]|nr:MAG: radical SAM family heme chaperone HemW [Verrucomicrobiota bacterium]
MLLYLHIPFCHRICPYCSFYKHTPGDTSLGAFVVALASEARRRVAQSTTAPRTLYLGGGTPSMLSPRHLRSLFEALHAVVDFGALEEVTLEANPATFDVRKARLFRELGVTRVSLGIQSFDAQTLATLGREHTAAQAVRAVNILRQADMPAVNIDLMFSIPGQSKASWQATLEQALALHPEHISAYNLSYEEDTAFFDALRRGEMHDDEDHNAEFFHLADAILSTGGFDHYETSNFARPGHHSLHNGGYWRGEDYLGLGPSAVSTIDNVRSKNVADTARYITQIHALGHAMVEAEILDPEARRLEHIALGLRTSEGIALDLLSAEALDRAGHLATAGLLRMTGERLVLIHHGRALVDPIAAELV